ncbi:MAG: hypothetical protein ACRDFX_01680, partial [Chloroflexota bacterium]
VGQPSAESGEQVERLRIADDTAPCQQFAGLRQTVLRDLELCRRGLEPQDCALEQQLVAGEVSSAELDEEVHDSLERLERVIRQGHRRLLLVDELLRALRVGAPELPEPAPRAR